MSDRTRSDHEDAPCDQKRDERGRLPQTDQRDHDLASGELGERQPDRRDLRAEAAEAATTTAAEARPGASSQAADRKRRREDRVEVDRVQRTHNQVARRRRDEVRGEKCARGEERKEIALVHARGDRVKGERDDRESEQDRNSAISEEETARYEEADRDERDGAQRQRGHPTRDDERVRRP